MTHRALQLQNTDSRPLARSGRTPALLVYVGGRIESLICKAGCWASIKSSLIGRSIRFSLYGATAVDIPMRRRPNPVHLHDRNASPGGVVRTNLGDP
jgi:hypothetical protein